MEKKQIIPSAFLSECKSSLGFLMSEYNFSKPKIINKKHSSIEIAFFKQHIAIECSYDLRDEMASIYITKLDNGKIPNYYRVNEKGKVVREHLISLLTSRGVKDFRSIIIDKNNSTMSEQHTLLHKYLLENARLLKTYCQDILNDSTEIFNDISPKDGDKF